MLGLLRRSVSTNINQETSIYHYSQIPINVFLNTMETIFILLKDIKQLEQLQHRTMKYILNDYTSNYKINLDYLSSKFCL